MLAMLAPTGFVLAVTIAGTFLVCSAMFAQVINTYRAMTFFTVNSLQ